MRHLRPRHLLLLATASAALTLTACDDDRPNAADVPTMPGNLPPNALSAYITVSDPDAAVGEMVTVTIRALRGSSIGHVGSFTLKLDYDSTRLRFEDASQSAHGMVLTNTTQAGVMIAAGASASGFTDDQLVSATFRVTGAQGLRSLLLTVDELNSVAFEDQKGAMRVERSLYRERAGGQSARPSDR